MKKWHIIFKDAEYVCDFVSVNWKQNILWLKLNGKSFRVNITEEQYRDAKWGKEVKTNAESPKQKVLQPIKLIFKYEDI